MYVTRLDRAADYRRQAQDARSMAIWTSLNDAKQQLLALAQHLEAMAVLEEREARKKALIRSPLPER